MIKSTANLFIQNKTASIGANKQHGFTLLEVLVAIVVLSVGLLGLAGLQANSLNNNQTAYYRSIATQQAYDMADRIRSNIGTTGVGGVRAGNYDSLSTMPTNPTCNATSGCTPSQMATRDFFQWRTNTQTLLPSGTGTVVGTVVGTVRTFVITVSWTEKTATGNVTQSFQTTISP